MRPGRLEYSAEALCQLSAHTSVASYSAKADSRPGLRIEADLEKTVTPPFLVWLDFRRVMADNRGKVSYKYKEPLCR